MAKRISFYEPADLSAEVVSDMLSLVGVAIDEMFVRPWTELERLLAYDWAIRVHLRASDNIVRIRPRPSFIPKGLSDG